MRIILCLLFLILVGDSAQAQNEDHTWMLGFTTNAPDSLISIMAIDFNETPSTITKIDQEFSFFNTNTIVSNSEGELQCYSNGVEIRNSNHEVIINGEEFIPSASNPLGNSMRHGSLLLPTPEANNQYVFLFGESVFYDIGGDLEAGISPLTYSYLDMNANNGGGEVIEKKSVLCTDTLSFGLLTSTRHANGRDWWILMNKNESNSYYRFLLNPEGVVTDGFQVIGDTIIDGLAQAIFSPDGDWYAQYNWSGIIGGGQPTDTYIDIYQFDRCTGLLSNHLQIKDEGNGVPGGVSFSPSSKYLYISGWDKIYQFDLEAVDVAASRDTVAIYDGFEYEYNNITYQPRFYNMQNTPDGKIYISCPNTSSRYLHVIDQPDSAGIACNVLQHHIELPAFNLFSLPNLPNYRLGALEGSPCDTLKPIATFTYSDDMLEVTFEDMTSRGPTTWYWDFGDNMTSDEQHPVHDYSTPGTYEVCLIASNAIGSDTVCQEITLMVNQVIELKEPLGLQVYPNPADDFLYLNFNTPLRKTYQFQLVNYAGKQLLSRDLSQDMSKYSINTSQFPIGLYMYHINDLSGELIVTGKFVISRL